MRGGEPAAHAARPAAVARRQAAGRRQGACCRRRPCWALSFDEALLQARRDEPTPSTPALRAPGRGRPGARSGTAATAALSLHARAAARSGLREPAAVAPQRAARARRPRARGSAVGPSPAAAERPRGAGHHWSFTADKAKGARYLMVAGDRARAVYANDDAIRHYERALATLAELARPATTRSGSCASGWPTFWRSPDSAPTRWRTTRPCADELEAAGDRRRRGAPAAQDRRAALGGRRPRARQRLLRRRASSGWARTAIRSSAPSSSRRWVAWRFAPATMRAPSPGPSGRLPRRRGGRPPADAERVRETAATRAQAYNTLGVALARTGPPRRGGRTDRAQHRARRGARPAAGGLPRLHQPRRALELARPAAQHRDLPARPRDRQEGRRPRLPVAAARQPGGGLLRADQSLRGRGHRGGAKPRSTSTAGSA